MDFLKNNRLFSFVYGDRNFSEYESNEYIDIKEDRIVKQYSSPDGLTVTLEGIQYAEYGAYKWVLSFENKGEDDTKLISSLWDCDVDFAFDYDKKPAIPAVMSDTGTAKIYSPKGSQWMGDDFCSDADAVSTWGQRLYHILPGDEKCFATSGGRSSQKRAPFFDINRREKGVICAIGWSGQWNCRISRNNTHINFRSGIENVGLRLRPGEKIRTSSVVVMPYKNGQADAHNMWRKLVKERFSPLPLQNGEGPLCALFWGGAPSEELIKRINYLGKNNTGFEYAWVDAGWYGSSVKPSLTAFDGDWGAYTGDWEVNTNFHPNGLIDVADTAKANNMKFLLWFEPERIVATSNFAREHADLCISRKDNTNLLLNLGDEKAWDYCFSMLAKKIETLNISCLRIDFNIDPLDFWRENDKDDRKGISEIKYIMGLYRLWDALIARFPELLIDNCASGGRRIDIETASRSISLWRTDYACTLNYAPEVAQTHMQGYSWWLPYTGTTPQPSFEDLYRWRSGYSAAMSYPLGILEHEDLDSVDLGLLKERNAEYLAIRKYFSCDFYQLTEPSVGTGSWCVYQFDDPNKAEGIILAFRREKSPNPIAILEPGGLSVEGNYIFTDTDNGETEEYSVCKLKEKGLKIEISEKRRSKLIRYRKK